MLKALHIINGATIGGAEIQLCNLLQHWAPSDRRDDVLVLLGEGPLSSRLATHANRVSHLGLGTGYRDFGALLSNATRYRDLASGYDVIQTWLHQSDLFGLAIRTGDTGLVWGVHHGSWDSRIDSRRTRVLARGLARASGLVDSIVFCSENARESHEALGYARHKSAVVPNGIDLARFKVSPVPSSHDYLKIAVVGRNHPMKGFRYLWRALALMPHADSVKVRVVGPGFGQEEMALATSSGSQVEFLGPSDQPEKVLQWADVFAQPSVAGEAMSMSTLEAIACGCLPIVGDSGALSDLVKGVGGYEVAPRSAPSLAAALESVWGQLPTVGAQRVREARARAVEPYSVAGSAKEYDRVHSAAVAHRRETRRRWISSRHSSKKVVG